MFGSVLNKLLQFILQQAWDVYQLELLSIFLLIFDICHHISSNVVHGQIHVTMLNILAE